MTTPDEREHDDVDGDTDDTAGHLWTLERTELLIDRAARDARRRQAESSSTNTGTATPRRPAS